MSDETYDQHYSTPNHYRFRRWVYAPFVRALLKKAGVRSGEFALDVGCGQGQFTNLIAERGIYVTGVDRSQEAIASARAAKADRHACFGCGDVLSWWGGYDMVFCRAFSPYNSSAFSFIRSGMSGETTNRMLNKILPGGVLIWTYPSRLRPADGQDWRWHTVAEARRHFAPFGGKVYFTLRLECRVLGRFAFNPVCTWLAQAVCVLSGHRIGGELVAIVRKAP